MPQDCNSIYFAELAQCDATFQAEKAACAGDPACIHLANQRRAACEQAAYLKWIQCIGQTNLTTQPDPDGAPGCGCQRG